LVRKQKKIADRRFVCQPVNIAAGEYPQRYRLIPQTTERAAVQLHTYTRGLFVGAISVAALTCGAGVAQADPDTIPAPGPGIIVNLLTQTPILAQDPSDEGGPSGNWGGVGMFCENQQVHCR
jgi:hypothetical protein